MKAKFRDLNHPRRAAELGTDLCFNATSDIVVSQKVFVNHQMIKDVFAKLDYHCIWLPSLFILLNWCGSIFQVAWFLGGFAYILCLNKWDDYRAVDHPAECRKWSNEKRFGWKPSETNSTKTNRLPCAVKRWNVSGEYGSSLQWHRNSSLQRSFKGVTPTFTGSAAVAKLVGRKSRRPWAGELTTWVKRWTMLARRCKEWGGHSCEP